MGATPRSELFWLGIFNYINYHAFEKAASDVTYYLSHEESVTKAWFLRWAKDVQHSHPRGKVHTEMQWTISRRFFDCSNWALLQHLWGCTYCAVLLSGLWHCQARLMCQLPEVGQLEWSTTRQGDEDTHAVYRWRSVNRGGPRRLLQQPQF